MADSLGWVDQPHLLGQAISAYHVQCAILGDFLTAVPVKHGKEAGLSVGINLQHRCVCVFLMQADDESERADMVVVCIQSAEASIQQLMTGISTSKPCSVRSLTSSLLLECTS